MRQVLFWVVGGDPRFAALAQALAEEGHGVHTFALGDPVPGTVTETDLKGLREAECVILPLPAADGENVNAPLAGAPLPLSQVIDAMVPGQLLCAGRAGQELRALAQARGVELVDYFHREELAVANAVPGALAVWPCEKARQERGILFCLAVCIPNRFVSCYGILRALLCGAPLNVERT